MTIAKSERLTVLSAAEQEALYGLPDFDDARLCWHTWQARLILTR